MYLKSILLTLLVSLFCHNFAMSKLLDKVAGGVNEKIFTLSEIERIIETLDARKEISPMIYNQPKYNPKSILDLLQKKYVIKESLNQMGFVINDDSVESRIKETQSRLGLNRDDLLSFLESKNLSFNEYFELIREAMEFNIFNTRIILPLVNITDQELKNHYYKLHNNKKTLAFRYDLVDFSIPKSSLIKEEIDRLPNILQNYRSTGNLPQVYKNLSTNKLGELKDEDLPSNLSKLLSETSDKSFTSPIILDGIVHVFYLEKKELSESQDYLRQRDQIYNDIFIQRSKKISEGWFRRKFDDYYILNNL